MSTRGALTLPEALSKEIRLIEAEGSATQAKAEGLTQLQRLTRVFTQPASVFKDLFRSRSWWLPFLVLSLASYGFSAVLLQRIGLDKLTYQALHQNAEAAERFSTATPEVQAKTYAYTRTSLQVTFAAAPLLLLASSAIIALVLWPSLNFLFGGNATFGLVFPAVLYASVISVLKAVIGSIVLLGTDAAESFRLGNPIGTNVGFYLQDVPAWVRSAAGSLDIVTLWYLVVLSIGCAVVAKVSRGAAFTAVFGWWLLTVMVSAGWAMLA